MARTRSEKTDMSEISVPTASAGKGVLKQEKALDHLRDMILSQKFPAGTRLTEDFIESETGLGRSPIRYALSMLEREGLVRVEPRRDTLVRTVELTEVDKILGLRFAIETLVAATLAKKPLCDQQPLHELHKAMVAIVQKARLKDDEIDSNDKYLFSKTDIAFHSKMAELSGYPQAVDFLSILNTQTRLFAKPDLQTAAMMDAVLVEHAAILKALADNDPAAAREAVQSHITSAAQRWSPCHLEFVSTGVKKLMGVSDPSPPPAATPPQPTSATDISHSTQPAPSQAISQRHEVLSDLGALSKSAALMTRREGF
jgi:GntR family transcriptional regulator, rspAB operon transcriptional repressor